MEGSWLKAGRLVLLFQLRALLTRSKVTDLRGRNNNVVHFRHRGSVGRERRCRRAGLQRAALTGVSTAGEKPERRAGYGTPPGAKRERTASPNPRLAGMSVPQVGQPGEQEAGAPLQSAIHLRRSSAWTLFFLPGHEMLREDAGHAAAGPILTLRPRFPLPEAGGIARVPAALAGLGGPGIRWLAAAAAGLPARQLEGRGAAIPRPAPAFWPHPPGSRGLQSYSFPTCQRNFSSL